MHACRLSRRRLLQTAAALPLPGLFSAANSAHARTAVQPAVTSKSFAYAQTPVGRFRGQHRIDDGVQFYKGIPFIQNPYLPERRFLSPVPVEPFEGTLDCGLPGAIPLQPDAKGGMVGGNGPLCLNVWAPEYAEAGMNLPVMVWVPGGGSIRCDQNDPRFDGNAFALNGIILVTLAYRVNIDGFLKIDGGDSNLGIRDIIAGLKWVKQNIAGFGGDPNRITAFGQSAGATHLVDVIASPAARGLLSGAIIQSPSAVAQWKDESEADRAAEIVARALGASPTRESLMTVPFEKLAAIGPLSGKLAADLDWAQFTNGNTSLFKGWIDWDSGGIMPERPVEAIARGACAGLNVIAGSTSSEWRYYIVPNGRIDELKKKDAERLLVGANRPISLYESYERAGKGRTPGDIFAQIQSDIIFRMPCVKLLESLAAGGANVWAYDFAWQSPVLGQSGAVIGAAHTTDVPFVFKTFKAPKAIATNGRHAPTSLADTMHGAWATFAKTQTAPWTTFNLGKRRAMRFDVQSTEVADPWAFERMTLPAI